ncbi:MAG: glycosyltransferase [Negativicutes bacterium]|nr:glycosyltransferase [Negativicutes bacterium]
MNISVCMIVKNEAEILGRCLESVRPWVSEIVVVDTGSADDTKAIARQFADGIYNFTWCDDFAKARNFSLEKAQYDWVLVLDADELVTEFDQANVRLFSQNDKSTVGRIKLVNLFEDQWGATWHTERVGRFFNRQFFHYKGIIHEQIVSNKNWHYQSSPLGITVEHLGYTREIMRKKDKLQRNIALLKQAIVDDSGNPYLYYQLGKSYFVAHKHELACVNFLEALTLPLNFADEYAEDLVESYGYALLNNGQYDEALKLGKYAQYYPNSPDFCFLLGLVYMNMAFFDLAVEKFHQCISPQEGKIKGINSYLATYNIAVIYECLGHFGQAMDYYKRCGDYKPAKQRLSLLQTAAKP